MDHRKKILILYASVGHGHEKAAKALLQTFSSYPHVEAKAIDTATLVRPFFSKLYRETYFVQIQYIPWAWGMFYFTLNLAPVYHCLKWIRRGFNAFTGKKLETLIRSENADVIISTHFMSTEVVAHLKTKNKIQSKIITVVTDYLPHLIWTAKGVDFYTVALEEAKEELIQMGVEADKIKITGIPIDQKFLNPEPQEALRKKMGLELARFTVLVTSGGAGIGDTQKLVEKFLDLKEPVQILAVCGTNHKMFETLERRAKDRPQLKVFGFVNNMNELMTASDLIIGKGGGLTLTESLVLDRPMVLFHSVPGQETRNADCVTRYHAGYVTNSMSDVVKKLEEVLARPQTLTMMKQGIAKMVRPQAAKEICDFVNQLN